jgi:hypothetical protein
VKRRITIAGVSQRAVTDPSEPRRDNAATVARGGPSKRSAIDGRMLPHSGRGDRWPALGGARDQAAMAERTRVRPRSRTTDRPGVVAPELRSAAGPSWWYLNCPCCGGRWLATGAMPAVPGAHHHDRRAVPLPAACGCALRRRLSTQRRRCRRPRATAATTMRNAATIAEVQRALGVDAGRAGCHGQRASRRRAATSARTHARLETSEGPPPRLAVDRQAAPRPSMAERASVSPRRPLSRGDSLRLTEIVPGRTRTDPPPDRAAR